MTKLTIDFTATDFRVLDNSVRKVFTGLRDGEYTDARVEVRPNRKTDEGVVLNIRMVIVDPTKKLITALTLVDVPNNVGIFMR
jgi:ribosomal protein S10